MRKILLLILAFVIIAPVFVMGSTGINGQVPPGSNEIIAGETARLISDLLDEEGQLRTSEGNIMEQPFYLQMNAPETVRERIVSRLVKEGIKITDSQTGYHTLKIEWESDNSLIRESDIRNIRTMKSEVIFYWLDPDQVIQKTWKELIVQEDSIQKSQIDAVSSNWNPASFHRRESTRKLSIIRRVAEPALIASVVAVTVYLLYNVRR